MVEEITGGHTITYHPEGPEGPAWEIDFTPPFKKVSMIDELEKKLNVKFPSAEDLQTDGIVFLQYFVILFVIHIMIL